MHRDGTLDLMRVGACIAVIVLHTAASYIYRYGQIPLWEWNFANVIDSMVRWCVPVFVLLSGLLNINERNAKCIPYWKKRFSRLIPVIIFWSFAYFLYIGNNDFSEFKRDLIMGVPYYHLYFLFLIAGLYFITPTLSVLLNIKKDTQFAKIAYIILFIICMVWLFGKHKMHALTWFIPYIGYYMLGGVLYRRPMRLNWAVAGLLCSIIVTALGTWYLVDIYGPSSKGLYLYTYLSPSVIVMSLCIYSIFIHVKIKEYSWLRYLSSLTLGVYLLHVMVLEVLSEYLTSMSFMPQTVSAIMIVSFLVVMITFSLIAIASMIPGFRRVII